MKMLLIFVALLFASNVRAIAAPEAQECLDCHRGKTPAAVRQWESSAHAGANVGCATCHGKDHKRIENGEAKVSMKICGPCHQTAWNSHKKSRHGMGLHSGWGCTRKLSNRPPGECLFCHEKGSANPISRVQCARFLTQSSEMGENGCNRCHSVETSCASCHTNHGTDLKIVRDPAICAKCHMGPDHPQWEMWQTSLHGILYNSAGETLGPSCQACHMPKGTHDVSKGITMSSGCVPLPPEQAALKRQEMIHLCSNCHAPLFATKEMERGDSIRTQSLALVKEAEQIIQDLAEKSLLDPMPDKRPPHPLHGSTLVLDAQMLYEDTSAIERIFFKMKKYDLAKTIKGSYHQNPAYTHWYGNAELKMDLVDIKSEANRLKERGGVKTTPDAQESSADMEGKLRFLKKKADAGSISQEEYSSEKRKILNSR